MRKVADAVRLKASSDAAYVLFSLLLAFVPLLPVHAMMRHLTTHSGASAKWLTWGSLYLPAPSRLVSAIPRPPPQKTGKCLKAPHIPCNSWARGWQGIFVCVHACTKVRGSFLELVKLHAEARLELGMDMWGTSPAIAGVACNSWEVQQS